MAVRTNQPIQRRPIPSPIPTPANPLATPIETGFTVEAIAPTVALPMIIPATAMRSYPSARRSGIRSA